MHVHSSAYVNLEGSMFFLQVMLALSLSLFLFLFLSLQGWPLFHQLLIDLFKFLAPFLRNAELTKPTQLLYKVSFYDTYILDACISASLSLSLSFSLSLSPPSLSTLFYLASLLITCNSLLFALRILCHSFLYSSDACTIHCTNIINYFLPYLKFAGYPSSTAGAVT